MRTLALCCAVACSSLLAQSPLETTMLGDAAAWTDAAVYFDLDVRTTISIRSLEVNLDDLFGSPGTLEVWLGPESFVGSSGDATLWGLAASGPLSAQGADVPTPCSLTAPVVLGPGRHAVALRHVGLSPRYSFAFGSGALATTPEVTMLAGAIGNVAFTGVPLSPRVPDVCVHYDLGGTPVQTARLASYGAGCYASAGAFCEVFTGAHPFDLDDTTFRLVPNAQGGYDVTRTAGPVLILPSNALLPLGDDRLADAHLPWVFPFPGGSTTSIRICSNGYLWLQPSGIADYTPTAAEFAQQPARLALAWTDFNPGAPGSGGVSFERDPLDRFVTITYDDIWLHGTFGTTLSTFQCVLYPDGQIEIRYGSVAHENLACIVGFTPGNANLGQPATAVDMSLVTTMHTAHADPLELVATQRPLPGASVLLATRNVPQNPLLVLNLIAFQQIAQGVDLAALGAPGCRQYVITNDADLLFGNYTRSLGPIPFDSIFLGLHVFSQSVALVPGVNPIGALTSNGVDLRIGDL